MTQTLLVKVKPNAKETKIISKSESEMTIALAAPATNGKANLELIKFLKKTFKTDIKILRGKTSNINLSRDVFSSLLFLSTLATTKIPSLICSTYIAVFLPSSNVNLFKL